MKFDFSKSIDTDLQNKLSIDKLDILMKNVLYCTHRLDKIYTEIIKLRTDQALQKQVDDYFDDTENIPEEVPDKDGDN